MPGFRQFVTLTLSLILIMAFKTSLAETFSGDVRDVEGKPIAGAFVSAKSAHTTWSVTSATDGSWSIGPVSGDGEFTLSAHRVGFARNSLEGITDSRSGIPFILERKADITDDAVGAAFIAAFPDGEEKRKLIVDCMGCHPMNQPVIYKDGELIDEAAHKAAVEKMLSFAGASTAFPVMSPEREAATTAAFLAKYLTKENLEASIESTRAFKTPAGGYIVTEYDLPAQRDLPHDVRLDGSGRLLVTGMFSNRIYMLNTETGAFDTAAIPGPGGNPRALDVDESGNWLILGGMSMKVSRFDVGSSQWSHYDMGMYPHSVMADAQGRAWFNGHFTKDPVQMGFVDTWSGETTILEVPPIEGYVGSPIPYGLRVGADGTVWSTELAGNRLIKYSPEADEFKTYTLPKSHSGPRRLDVAGDGTVWIPEFAGERLAMFDPMNESFTEIDFPSSNSLPYCARIDHTRRLLWVSQCGTDAIARVDMTTMDVIEYRLPTHIAFLRHLDVDQETGDVWGAYSHSPGLHPGVVRLQVQ